MSVGDWLTEPQGPSFLVILPKRTSYSEITTSLSKIQNKRKDRIGQQKRTPYSSQLPSPAAAAIKRRSRGYAVATLPSISLLLYVEHANNLARPAERTHIDRLRSHGRGGRRQRGRRRQYPTSHVEGRVGGKLGVRVRQVGQRQGNGGVDGPAAAGRPGRERPKSPEGGGGGGTVRARLRAVAAAAAWLSAAAGGGGGAAPGGPDRRAGPGRAAAPAASQSHSRENEAAVGGGPRAFRQTRQEHPPWRRVAGWSASY